MTILSNMPFQSGMGSTNRQRLARAAERAGCDVDFVETIGWRAAPPRFQKMERVDVRHLWNIAPRAARPTAVAARRVNAGLSVRSSSALRGALDEADLIVSFDPLEVLTRSVSHASRRVIYYCVDAYEFQPHIAGSGESHFTRIESEYVERSAAAVCTSTVLCEYKAALWGSDRPAYIPGSFEPVVSRADAIAHWSRRPRRDIPTALILAALDRYKTDAREIGEIARANPNWRFHVYGRATDPIGDISQELRAVPNVEVRDAVNVEYLIREAPAYAVGLVCMTESDYSRHSFPLKIWDYMSLGLPVAAVNAPSLVGVPEVTALVATDLSEFEQSPSDEALASRMIDRAYGSTADHQWSAITRVAGAYV
ncbi:MAG: glycosyltransferase [Gordonia paraffinivorans]